MLPALEGRVLDRDQRIYLTSLELEPKAKSVSANSKFHAKDSAASVVTDAVEGCHGTQQRRRRGTSNYRAMSEKTT